MNNESGIKACSVDGCCGKVIDRGLCWPHYQRQRRGVSLEPPIMRPPSRAGQVCKVDGCGTLVMPNGRRAYSGNRGMCAKHYGRSLRGAPLDWVAAKHLPCRGGGADGCAKPTHCKGLCLGHYRRLRNGQPIDTPLRPMRRRT